MAGPSHEANGRSDASSTAPPGFVLRVLLVAAVLLAGLAVAAPGGRGEAPVDAAACAAPAGDWTGAAGVIVLPPGHPPIPGQRARGPAAVQLPPGHPPIDERHLGLPVPARPASPAFQAPATVDL
jgi:hypothetical protein